MTEDDDERPCPRCGELTSRDDLCYDCGIEAVMDQNRCKHCGRHIWNSRGAMIGLAPYDHAPECPVRSRWDA
jgi:hypothetical protein